MGTRYVGQEVEAMPCSYPIRLRVAFKLGPIRASRFVRLPSWRLKTLALHYATARGVSSFVPGYFGTGSASLRWR